MANGYTVLYNQTYGRTMTTTEIESVKACCTPSTMLCMGGSNLSGMLLVVACGNCRVVATSTIRDSPVFSTSAWFYLTFDYSFGFAPISTIKQSPDYDSQSTSDEFRVSWVIDKTLGGRRLGSMTNLQSSDQYYKMMFLR